MLSISDTAVLTDWPLVATITCGQSDHIAGISNQEKGNNITCQFFHTTTFLAKWYNDKL